MDLYPRIALYINAVQGLVINCIYSHCIWSPKVEHLILAGLNSSCRISARICNWSVSCFHPLTADFTMHNSTSVAVVCKPNPPTHLHFVQVICLYHKHRGLSTNPCRTSQATDLQPECPHPPLSCILWWRLLQIQMNKSLDVLLLRLLHQSTMRDFVKCLTILYYVWQLSWSF